MIITNKLSLPLRIEGKSLYSGSNKAYLNGTNVAYQAWNKGAPEEFVKFFFERGYNWLRAHHIDGLIRRGELTVERMVAILNVMQTYGMVFSCDGISDHKAYPFNSLYQEQNEQDYAAYLTKIAPILRHPVCFMLNLVNENFTNLKNAGLTGKIPAFCRKWKAFVRDLGFNGLVTDGGDANIDPPHFAPLMSEFDIVVAHCYGTHPEQGMYHPEDWKFRGELFGVTRWLAGLVKCPTLVQEWGCLPFDDGRAANGAFMVNECRRGLAGICSYQWASNIAQMRGEFTQIDDYSICTDYPRILTDLLSAALTKFDKNVESDYYWGHVQPTSIKDTNYRRTTEQVSCKLSYGQGKVVVKAGYKKLLVFLLDQTQIRGFAKTDVAYKGGTWIRPTNRGGKTLGTWDGIVIDVGAPVSGAYRLSPWTLEKVGTMVKAGNTFTADKSCAVYEVNIV